MTLYNLMSCRGFIEQSTASFSFDFGPCMQARLVLVFLFFINAFIRKWGGEEMGIDYSFWWGLGIGFLAYMIPLTLLGNIKVSFLIGLAGMVVGGYLLGAIFGSGGDEYE